MPTTTQLLDLMRAGIEQRQADQAERRRVRQARYAAAVERRAQERFRQARRTVRRGDFSDAGLGVA